MPVRVSDDKVDTSILKQPLHFKHSGRKADNRFIKAAMTERLCSWDDDHPEKRGIPDIKLERVYAEWAKGNWGVILSGNTFGNYRDLEAKGNPIMRGNEPERLEGFKKVAAAAKSQGALYIIQLSHAGRQVPSDINPYPVSASDVRLSKMSGNDVESRFAQPTSLTTEQIEEIVQEWGNAAKYAYDTGADGVQLHSAHGYLLAQFLAPSTNKRTDKYGGSLENRYRIHLEILDKIAEMVPDKSFIRGIKLNSVEYQEGGFSTEDAKTVCSTLEAHGVDFIELSGGTYEELAFGPRGSAADKKESTKLRESYFLEFADRIRSGVKDAVIYVTGGFRTAKGMVAAVQDGSCDGVGLARPVTEEYDLPKLILDGTAGGAKKSAVSDSNFMAGNGLSCYQMAEVGDGKKPTDNNDEAAVDEVLKKLGAK